MAATSQAYGAHRCACTADQQCQACTTYEQRRWHEKRLRKLQAPAVEAADEERPRPKKAGAIRSTCVQHVSYQPGCKPCAVQLAAYKRLRRERRQGAS